MIFNQLLNRWFQSNVMIAFSLFLLILVISYPQFPLLWDDSPNYILMATGHSDAVAKPFAGRIFAPFLASTLTSLLNVTIENSFEYIAITCLAFWCLALVSFWTEADFSPRYRVFFILLSPVPLVAFQEIYIPDLIHMMGIGLFFVALKHQRLFICSVLMIILITIRETSIILSVLAVFFLFKYRRYVSASVLMASSVFALLLVHHFSSNSTNIHHMPELLYLALKIPVNFMNNILGISFWTNSFQWCFDPLFKISVPDSINLGRIDKIGICHPNLTQPLLTAASLTVFGILPSLLISLLKNAISRPSPDRQLWWVIAFSYGSIMTILGLISGTAVLRLVGYGWPLFFVCLPLLLKENTIILRSLRVSALVLHATIVWGTYLLLQVNWSMFPYLHLPNISFTPLASFLSLLMGVLANTYLYLRLSSVRDLLPDRK